jgi:predicted DNA-binding protein
MANTYNFSLRMPIELGETIEAMSKTVRRPMNTEIVLLLEYALKEKGRKRNAKKAHIPDYSADAR